jgi:hypothetical protein
MPEWRTLFGVINGWTIIGMFVLMAVITIVKIIVSQRQLAASKSFK